MIAFALRRLGTVMAPEPGNTLEADGVLNPASGRTPDGRLHLLPRLVAAGNVSRVGLAAVVVADGVPVGVERRGVVLEPATTWERGSTHAGVEDPRVTFVPRLGLHVMTYVAYGPLGPRIAAAVSDDLETWRRLGPLLFRHEPELDADLNLYPNKDAVWFPEPVPGPGGVPSYALLHRPMWRSPWLRGAVELPVPPLDDTRPGIWVSYVPAAAVEADVRAITVVGGHRIVAGCAHEFERVKIGAGPPPIRVAAGWLLIHHGVAGHVTDDLNPQMQRHAVYSAGAMLLDADDPSQVIERTPEPLLEPETADEVAGTVSNVVFPTAIADVGERRFVFYGMADARIGVAELVPTG